MEVNERPKAPPVKIDWERIYQSVANCVSDYAASLLKDESERLPYPGRWDVDTAKPIMIDQQSLYLRIKRDIKDVHGRPVMRFGAKSAAELSAMMSPDVVLVLLETIESLSAIVARYRNAADGSGIHTAERVRGQVVNAHCEAVANKIVEKIVATCEEHREGMPNGCNSYRDMEVIATRPRGKGRAASYKWKNPEKNKGKKRKPDE